MIIKKQLAELFGCVTEEQLAALLPQERETFDRIMKKKKFIAINGALFFSGFLISSLGGLVAGVALGVTPAVLIFTGGTAISSIPIGFCLFRIDKYESPEGERRRLLNPRDPLHPEHGTFSIDVDEEDSSCARWACWPCSFFSRRAYNCKVRLQQLYYNLPSLRR